MQLKRFIKSIVLTFFAISPLSTLAQSAKQSGFQSPLKIPILLSGNFGELRSNHLHSGLDFRTYGLPGLNVYATDDGFVSRIKIEPDGFGNAIYINHPNGYTSVYGHLLRFRKDIDSICNDRHYRENKFGIEIFFKPNELSVKKGEMIAFSGNAGGSMGPHLHFELRDKSQTPVNIQHYFSFPIKDTIPPKIFNLWIYPLDSISFVNHHSNPQCFQVVQTGGNAHLNDNQPIPVKGKFFIGLETLDFMNSSINTLGIYAIELYMNNHLTYSQVIDKISFSENRSVNSLIDYGYYQKKSVRINRFYVQPNNKLPIYRQVKNRGILQLDGSNGNIRIHVSDNSRNTTELVFDVKSDDQNEVTDFEPHQKNLAKRVINYGIEDSFHADQVDLHFPAFSVYDNFALRYDRIHGNGGFYSDIHYFNNEDIPINKTILLSIKAKNLPVRFQSKALIARISDQGNLDWFGGGFSGGIVSASIRSFGKYAVVVDTVAPSIIAINKFVKNQDYTDWDKISFLIKDEQAGISSYTGKIDNRWALFEYDEKQNLIFYRFDLNRISSKTKHVLDLVVIDKKGNSSHFHSSFYK